MKIKIYSTKLFKALSNSKRIKILLFLFDVGELTVSDISKELKMPFLTVSRHLLKLKAAGLVIDKRVSRNIFYRHSNNQIVLRIIRFIKRNFQE
ncbi:MAG: metalloregulator ArsR/SmtB family transcription factor [Elusimicrobiota bacterium]